MLLMYQVLQTNFLLVVPRDTIHNHCPGLESWDHWLLLSSRDLGSIFLIMVVSSIIQHFLFSTMVNMNDVKPMSCMPRLGSKFSGQLMKIFILKIWLAWNSIFAFHRHNCITYCHNLLQVHIECHVSSMGWNTCFWLNHHCFTASKHSQLCPSRSDFKYHIWLPGLS